MEYPNVQLFPGCTPERALGTSPDRISRRHVTPPKVRKATDVDRRRHVGPYAARRRETYDKLLGGEGVDMVFTDPPYNVVV